MFKKIVSLCVSALLLIGTVTVSAGASEEIIHNNASGIPDTVLYNALVDAFDTDGDSQLSVAEAQAAEYFFYSAEENENQQIQSLKGLQYFSNLTSLALWGNTFESLEGIETLTKLEELDLYYNELTTLAGIENLTNLLFLDVCENNLTNLNGVENLTSLQYLIAFYNSLTDISAVSNLTDLVRLDVYNNQLTTLPDLTKLTKLKPFFEEDEDGNSPFTDFMFNDISEDEFMAKLPAQLLANTKWLDDQIMYQLIPDFVVIGDVDLDGDITISDVTMIQKFLADMLDEFSYEQYVAADTNGDGEVSITDATLIQKYLADIIYEFPQY